jgi:hypothetical protein
VAVFLLDTSFAKYNFQKDYQQQFKENIMNDVNEKTLLFIAHSMPVYWGHWNCACGN